jgi:hypothetical protein
MLKINQALLQQHLIMLEPNTQTVESGAWRVRMFFTISNSALPMSSGG